MSDEERFAFVLNRFFDGKRDEETVEVIRRELASPRDDTPRDLLYDMDNGNLGMED